MLDINRLNEAIYDALNVSDITDLVSGVYHYKAPQSTSFPYVTYFVATGSTEDTFGEWEDEVLCQIDVWSDAPWPKEVGDISKEITEEMDEAELSATGYSVYFCQRVGAPRLLYENDTEIFHMVLEYKIKLEKSKG